MIDIYLVNIPRFDVNELLTMQMGAIQTVALSNVIKLRRDKVSYTYLS